jgi:hypothetical protein
MTPKIVLIIVVAFVVQVFFAGMLIDSEFVELQIKGLALLGEPPAGTVSADPMLSSVEAHQKIEEQILASTVRIVIQNWIVEPDESGYNIDQSVGHATVMSGSRLVTHNHFSLPLSIRQPEVRNEAYGLVILLDRQGQRLFQAPLSAFELVWEDSETLVFAYNDKNKFDELGLKPAEFVEWESLPLEVGMEVAQIDWDEHTTRVDWTIIKEVNLDQDAPMLVLEDGVMVGASGGGIFWEGKHIANNWRLRQFVDESGNVIDSVTTVALNSAEVAGL